LRKIAHRRRGIEPAYLMACAVWFLETVGAICIILGLSQFGVLWSGSIHNMPLFLKGTRPPRQVR